MLGTILLSELGFQTPPQQAAATVDEYGSIELSPENLDLVDGDLLFVEVREGATTYEESPLWATWRRAGRRRRRGRQPLGVRRRGRRARRARRHRRRARRPGREAMTPLADTLAPPRRSRPVLHADGRGSRRRPLDARAGRARRPGARCATWFDGLRAESKGAPDVAASYLAGWLGGIVLDPVGWALGTERRAWPLDPARSGSTATTTAGSTGSPSSRRRYVSCPTTRPPAAPDVDGRRRHRHAARRPRPRGRRRARPAVRDDPHVRAVRHPRHVGRGGRLARLERGVRGVPRRRARALARRRSTTPCASSTTSSRPAPAASRVRSRVRDVRAGTTTITHKGTCCLWYKTTDDTAPIGERYCLSCPLQPDPDQLDRWVAWLDERRRRRVVREGAGEEHSTP